MNDQLLADNAAATLIVPLIVYRMATQDPGLVELGEEPTQIIPDQALASNVRNAVNQTLDGEPRSLDDYWKL